MIIFSTDINSVVEEIVKREPLITATKVDKVRELIESNIMNIYFILIYYVFFVLRITRKNFSSR